MLNNRKDFDGSEILNLQCEFVRNYTNSNKYQIKNYEFINLKDTIIEGKIYGRYKLTPTDLKRAKRKKIGTQFYIIDKTEDFVPILNHPTAYEKFLINKNIPNGLLYQIYFVTSRGELTYKTTLINKYKIHKKIYIGKDCDDKLSQ